MKQSKLYGKALQAFRTELKRVNRELDYINRNLGRFMGSVLEEKKARRLVLWHRKTWLDRQIAETEIKVKRAKAGETYWERKS